MELMLLLETSSVSNFFFGFVIELNKELVFLFNQVLCLDHCRFSPNGSVLGSYTRSRW